MNFSKKRLKVFALRKGKVLLKELFVLSIQLDDEIMCERMCLPILLFSTWKSCRTRENILIHSREMEDSDPRRTTRHRAQQGDAQSYISAIQGLYTHEKTYVSLQP